MANKVVFGLKNVYVAMITNEATPAWDTPEAIPGAVNLSLSAQGDLATFYADNVAYYVSATNNGYTGEIEMALIPDAVLADMLGWEVDDNGALIEKSDVQPTSFALLFEVTGDVAGKRYCFYKCTASRPKEDHKTKADTTAPTTSPLALTIVPIEIDSEWIVKASIERTVANATVYDAWFTAVTEPSLSVS